MEQSFGISIYEKQTKPNKNWEFQSGGSPQMKPFKIQTF